MDRRDGNARWGGDSILDTDVIADVAAEYPVTLVVLYGSRAQGDATPNSDINLAISFDKTLSAVDRTRTRLSLIARLSVVLDTDDVDVVPLDDVPAALRRTIREDGVVIYGDPAALGDEREEGPSGTTHEDRLATFDAVLADLERIV